MIEEVNGLGTRVQLNDRLAQKTDRRAAAYASRLARQTARLLQRMPTAMPAVRPVAGTGASALRHYILKHERLHAPDRTRLLVVSSDGRLRVCTVSSTAGPAARLWIDYETTNPPAGLGLAVVFAGLSEMIVQLETVVSEREQSVTSREGEVDDLIAQTEGVLAGRDAQASTLDPTSTLEPDTGPDDSDMADGRETNDLRSYGFEHRLPVKRPPGETPDPAPPLVPTPLKAPQAPGLLSRLWR